MKKRMLKIGALFMAIALLLCGLSACDAVDKAKSFAEEKKNMIVHFRDVSGYYKEEEVAMFTAAAKEKAGKGMIVAIGGGFDTQENFRPLIDKCLEHTGKSNPKMLFVPTAHRDELEEKEEIVEWFEAAGCTSDVLLVSKASKSEVQEKISAADIIYATGGNLKFLTENWKEKGVYEEVKKAFDHGAALIGPSSGAMCWAQKGWDDCGEEVFRITDSFPFLGKDASYDYYDCAGLLPFCICPHFDNIAWRVYAFKAMKLDIPSLCIENGAAVVYKNGSYEVVSDEANSKRKAYLFHPDRKIVMMNVKEKPEFLSVVDGECRSK
ncbi:MAG: Type 1 glutamine amidotransferase-like domain-containing protein [Clostridia bacterium]|nr:Type 1 glutamine amidotransferase-like domain-containing protein [Clostridia bacterium]